MPAIESVPEGVVVPPIPKLPAASIKARVVVDCEAVEDAMVRNGDFEPVGAVKESVAQGELVPIPSL